MKRALFVFLAGIAAVAPQASYAGLFDVEGPWGLWGRRCNGEPGRFHPNGGGWVSNAADVQESARIMSGAQVCSGATVGPFATIGPSARLRGNVVVRDDSYVNSTVEGRVTIAGRSHVDTDEVIYGRRWGDGVRIVNSKVRGSATVADGAKLMHMDVTGSFEARGSVELCHIRGTLTRGSYRSGVHGQNCDEAMPSQTPIVHTEGDPYSRQAHDPRWAGYYQSHHSNYYSSCLQWEWDYRRNVWGCRSGTGSAYQPPYAHNSWAYDYGRQPYQQQQQGYWQRPSTWDEYYRQQWAYAAWQSRIQYESGNGVHYDIRQQHYYRSHHHSVGM